MNPFNDLPILFVDNYDDITTEYLNEKYEEFKQMEFNLDKLDVSYWHKKILQEFSKI